MQRISPFLWFDSQAQEAAEFYVSVFENSEIGKVTRYPEEAAKKIGREPGSVMTVPMSHGFGIAKHPLSWSPKNSLHLSSIDGIAQCGEKLIR